MEIVRIWRWLVPALVVMVVALAWPRDTSHRVAVRVECSDCTRTLALALDVWSEDVGPGMPLDVVIASDRLGELDAPYTVIVPDIDAAAEAERARIATAHPADWFDEFHDYEGIAAKLRELAATGRATMQPIGGSLEGRPIWALKIGRGDKMLINGTQHAREWIAASTATCIADRLVNASDPKLKAFVDTTELWVVPVVNPDGYQYSWGNDRYWRKNRRGRHGVDLNRNFEVAWGGPGSSGKESSEIYRGEYPFSEPESAALRDLSRRERFTRHIDFHAFGQLVLYPWGWTAQKTKDHDRFVTAAGRIASSIEAQHGKKYKPMQSVGLYPASGTMEDWEYGDVGALSVTIELRPKGGGGFVIEPEEIKPTCDEGLAAVLALRNTN